MFEIRRDGKLLGKREVSNGAIVWIPSHSKGATFRLWWKDFDTLMRAEGERVSAASNRGDDSDGDADD